MFGRNFALPRWADLPLRSLKYILLALFAYAVVSMPVPELRAFLSSPYGLVADVKMLDFFRDAGRLTIQVCLVPGAAVGGDEELLVPLPVPVRRADGAGVDAEPDAHHARSDLVHRLRQVRQGVPVADSRGPADDRPHARVQRLPHLRHRVPGEGRPGDADAGRPGAASPHRGLRSVWRRSSWSSSATPGSRVTGTGTRPKSCSSS